MRERVGRTKVGRGRRGIILIIIMIIMIIIMIIMIIIMMIICVRFRL